MPRYRDLADYLARSGETQAALAARVGCSQAAISRIATRVGVPSYRLAVRLADATGVPLESFKALRAAS